MRVERQETGHLAKAFRFAVLTGASRVVALGREVIAARYFGVTPAMSAFTVAFQIPNLLRSLFADSALQGAIVPVLGELAEKGRRGEVAQAVNALAATLTLLLGTLTVGFVIFAHPIIDVIAPGFAHGGGASANLAANLARVMFPVVLLISLSGIAAGALNAFDEFSIPAVAPALWNGVIVITLVAGAELTSGNRRVYLYAVGVVAGSVAQLLLPIPRLRRLGISLGVPRRAAGVHVRKMLKSMLPVTVALGVMNFSLLLDSFFGSLISGSAPAAIDKAFRLYQVPQGIFSVAIATVLFPALVREASRRDFAAVHARMARGLRGTLFLLLPTAAFVGALATPLTHAVYQRGAFDTNATTMTATALRWWAIAMPFAGMSTFLWRVLFSLNERRAAIVLTAVNLGTNVAVSAALYSPLGITGDVIGTVSGTVVMAVLQWSLVERRLRERGSSDTHERLLRPLVGMAVAAGAAWLVAYVVSSVLRPGDDAATIVWLGNILLAAAAAAACYFPATWLFGVPEARSAGGAARRLLASIRSSRSEPARAIA